MVRVGDATKLWEKNMVNRRELMMAGSLFALAPSVAFAESKNAAEIAVEAAKKYAGTEISIVWEAGLQSLDPLNYSGPKWEKLTGIKVRLSKCQPTRCSLKSCKTSGLVRVPMMH